MCPTATASTFSNMQVHADTSFESHPPTACSLLTTSSMTSAVQGGNDMQKDTILPCLNTLRQNQTVSQAVAVLVASYEYQARMDSTQGRQHLVKRSGHHNTSDIIRAPLHLRWRYEGFHTSNGRKSITYDDHTQKLNDIKQICRKWTYKYSATKNQLQKLTGKLLHIHRCVQPARLFLN